MRTYAVTIRATVTKTLFVSANSEQGASETAHQYFSILNEVDKPEKYDQDTIGIEVVEDSHPLDATEEP